MIKRTMLALLCALALLSAACGSDSGSDDSANTVADDGSSDAADQLSDTADDAANDTADDLSDAADDVLDVEATDPSAPVTPGNSTDEELVAAFTDDIVRSDDTMTQEEAECIGQAVVDEFGGDEMRAVGISADTMGDFNPELFEDGTNRAFKAIGECQDLGEFFASIMSSGDPTIEACIADNFSDEELLTIFQEPDSEVPSAEFDEISRRLEETCFAS